MENPAVLAETLWKNAPSHVTFSVSLSVSVPTTSKTKLGNDHHLGVQSKLLETLLFSYIQNNKKSQSAKNDQCTCGQIQKDIILIRRQVSKSSQNVKPRVIKGCNRMEILIPIACTVL